MLDGWGKALKKLEGIRWEVTEPTVEELFVPVYGFFAEFRVKLSVFLRNRGCLSVNEAYPTHYTL